MLAETLLVNLATANPLKMSTSKPKYCTVTVISPENETFNKENAILKFIAETNYDPSTNTFCYTLDKSGQEYYGTIWNGNFTAFPDLLKLEEKIISQIEIPNDPDSSGEFFDPYTRTTYECTANLPQLSYGVHNITIYRGVNYDGDAYYKNLQTFYFTPTELQSSNPEPFPTALVATAFGVSVAIALVSLLVYFRKKGRAP